LANNQGTIASVIGNEVDLRSGVALPSVRKFAESCVALEKAGSVDIKKQLDEL
jgi:hypothetical protein